jgi:hypothetical protein
LRYRGSGWGSEAGNVIDQMDENSPTKALAHARVMVKVWAKAQVTTSPGAAEIAFNANDADDAASDDDEREPSSEADDCQPHHPHTSLSFLPTKHQMAIQKGFPAALRSTVRRKRRKECCAWAREEEGSCFRVFILARFISFVRHSHHHLMIILTCYCS